MDAKPLAGQMDTVTPFPIGDKKRDFTRMEVRFSLGEEMAGLFTEEPWIFGIAFVPGAHEAPFRLADWFRSRCPKGKRRRGRDSNPRRL